MDKIEVQKPEVKFERVQKIYSLDEPHRPDLFLDVPKLHLDSAKFKIGKLDAKLAIKSKVFDTIDIDVGLNISLEDVEMELEGVDAEARFEATLSKVHAMMTKALDKLSDEEVMESLSRAKIKEMKEKIKELESKLEEKEAKKIQ